MAVAHPITIIGGGLAGLTLGIGLRRRGVPVTLIEAGHYPKHRVCGEFISGQGPDVLARMGLSELLAEAGFVEGHTALFRSRSASSSAWRLPSPALCVSRFDFDALLAREFRRLGGELREGERWRSAENSDGLVWASGRRAQAKSSSGLHWFGLKVHARNVTPEADLEMYLAASGYVGLCCLKDGWANICGLFRRRSDGGDASPRVRSWMEMIRGEPGTPLFGRLKGAEFDESSFCSVAGLSLRPQRACGQNECRIGDALTMIPPVTGNGMSMAFESAEISTAPLAAYSRGERNWEQTKAAIARDCDRAFGRRLRWARWLQWMMFSPILQTRAGSLALRSEWLWRTMFAKTR